MEYKYETHLHTSEGSACARNTAKEMVRAAKEAGYTGIFVTDHNWGGNTAVNRHLPWKEFVSQFNLGYYHAKEEGDRIGLQVFYGWEAGFHGTEFLIYGLEPDWLLEHPQIRHATIQEQYQLVHESGGIVVHAHPYREEAYISEIRLFPEYVDGVETINATHSNSKSLSHNKKSFNDRALEYAKKYSLPMTAGSDIHSVNLLNGGMIFDHRLENSSEFVELVQKKDYIALTDGERVWKNQ